MTHSAPIARPGANLGALPDRAAGPTATSSSSSAEGCTRAAGSIIGESVAARLPYSTMTLRDNLVVAIELVTVITDL